MRFSRKIPFLITSIPSLNCFGEMLKCQNAEWEMMKTMHLFAVCHVILTLNLTKGCFCYLSTNWEKAGENSSKLNSNQKNQDKPVIWITLCKTRSQEILRFCTYSLGIHEFSYEIKKKIFFFAKMEVYLSD